MGARDYWDRMLIYFGIAAEELEDRGQTLDDSRRVSERRSRAQVEPTGPKTKRTNSPSRQMPARSSSQNVAGVGVVPPRTFNDAQQIADQFKRGNPVIVNLQTTDSDLSKRIIDFGSGLTYGLDGSMQRIADKVFLLTPPDVEVSAEDRAEMAASGFFNQS